MSDNAHYTDGFISNSNVNEGQDHRWAKANMAAFDS